jgi:hypothetical protein
MWLEMREGFREIRNDIRDVRGEIGDLRGEMGDLRGETGREVGGLRSEIGALRSETGAGFQTAYAQLGIERRWLVGMWLTTVLGFLAILVELHVR